MASLLLPIIYLAFISLGLPDALLGAAWPTMYPQLGAQVSVFKNFGTAQLKYYGTEVEFPNACWIAARLR